MEVSSDSTDLLSSSTEEEIIRNVQIRKPKIIKLRQDHFTNFTDVEFFDRFRFTKCTTNIILGLIENEIKFNSQRNYCLTPMQQLLLTLRFFATGCMQISVGDFIGVTKATAGRTIKRVSEAIARLRPQYIYMPRSPEEKEQTHMGFFDIAHFPRVLGTIDCTHVKIQSPGGEDGEIYRCRKGYFSINVQTISNYDLKITNIIARWPGSCHDQTIFNNSNIKILMENGRYEESFLLGDNGYRNENYLLTPLLHTNNRGETLYNSAHIRTRNTVERQYGLWKRRFPCLSLGMRVSVPLVKTIIVATAVLHNIAITAKEPEPLDNDGIIQYEEQDFLVADENNEEVDSTRQIIINNYFANM